MHNILFNGNTLKPKVDAPLFAINANPLQLYHSPRAKILAFNLGILTSNQRTQLVDTLHCKYLRSGVKNYKVLSTYTREKQGEIELYTLLLLHVKSGLQGSDFVKNTPVEIVI